MNCANLTNTNLACANFGWTYLKMANFSGSYIAGANFGYSELSGATNIPYMPMACPETGSFIGYKKANNCIVVLEILADAKRSSATGRKCRCDKAKVIEIQNFDGTKSDATIIFSDFDRTFGYKVGEIVTVDNFCEDRWEECAPGIHFFVNRQEAVDY